MGLQLKYPLFDFSNRLNKYCKRIVLCQKSNMECNNSPEHSEKHFFNLETRMRISTNQSRTSRRDENLWHLISGFETRPRKMSFQSQASRRDRDLLSSISDFETRTRIEIKTILARIHENLICCLCLDWYFPKKTFNFLIFLKIKPSKMEVAPLHRTVDITQKRVLFKNTKKTKKRY